MPRRKSNLGRHTRRGEAVRKKRAKLTEPERAFLNLQRRQRCTELKIEQLSVKLEVVRLKKRLSLQNKLNELRMVEKCHRETLNQIQTAPSESMCEVYVTQEPLGSMVLETVSVKKEVEDCTVEDEVDPLDLDVAVKVECDESHWGEGHKQS